ncbi:MAG TPA: SAM-dependent methyltransferase [Alphaproteobacteria bacterium]|nr:SAM-dependent methyltransferase [Alphaproteobacteria bacterium]
MIPAGLPDTWTAYLAAEGFVQELLAELGDAFATFGRLALALGPPRAAAWAQNTWLDPVLIPIASIGDGAKALRRIQRNWALYAFHLHRRAALIEAQLPPVKARPIHFMAPPPAAPLGSWTLLDSGTMIAAAHCSSPFRHGELAFVEDKASPPNRAYLKLWEAFTLLQVRPEPGARCLDLGASPGGWAWVLQRCGARVIAVDKAPLAPAVARLPNVEFRRASAFALDPTSVGPIDWFFCDVVCYPTRLLKLVQRWLASGLARRFVCTLKFQGETDHATARAFAAIPGSRLIHLSHNKHELTWIRL